MNGAPVPVVGEIRGFRWWRLDREGWLVSPWRGEYRWDAVENRAHCLFRRGLTRWRPSEQDHPRGAPVKACDCGFYGVHQVPLPRDHVRGSSWQIEVESSGSGHGLVFGVVAAHGRTVIGTQGWRAEFARPMALFWGPRAIGHARLLVAVERYGLPLCRSLDALASEWGPDELERGLLAS